MSKKITLKHSAKVLTLRNVQMYGSSEERTLHFALIGGRWHYSGTTEVSVSNSDKDGFWKHTIAQILGAKCSFSLPSIKKSFYFGPNKSMQVYIRTWETNITKQEYQREKQGMPF